MKIVRESTLIMHNIKQSLILQTPRSLKEKVVQVAHLNGFK